MKGLPGIDAVDVNVTAARVAVNWQGRATSLPQILRAVNGAEFSAVPLAGAEASAKFRLERRTALKRLGVASLGMMQSMMYLAALAGTSDITPQMAQLAAIAGMIIVTPVLFYSGQPILIGAWRDITQRRVGMDVPVALALLLAWLPSVYNTFAGAGEVYFDSVGMFVFFLTAGRFLEMSARHRGVSAAEALARSLPSKVSAAARGRHARTGGRHRAGSRRPLRGSQGRRDSRRRDAGAGFRRAGPARRVAAHR